MCSTIEALKNPYGESGWRQRLSQQAEGSCTAKIAMRHLLEQTQPRKQEEYPTHEQNTLTDHGLARPIDRSQVSRVITTKRRCSTDDREAPLNNVHRAVADVLDRAAIPTKHRGNR